MKNRLAALFLSLLLVFGSLPATVFANESSPVDYGTPGEDYVEGQVIACVAGGADTLKTEGLSTQSASDATNIMDVSAAEKTEGLTTQANQSTQLVLVEGNSTTDMIAALEQNPAVSFAEPNYIMEMSGVTEPTDPGYPIQWGLNNINDDTHADINAPAAWAKTNDTTTPVVAVTDSGVDYNNPDLENVMWDEGENYPSLTAMGGGQYGYNPANPENSTDPMDTFIGHGTHCAGIIAEEWNNNIGGAGVSPNAKILATRMFSDDGNGNMLNSLKCFAYIQAAKKAGVNVVATSNSWGPGTYNSLQIHSISTAVTALGELGVVSIFSAGNYGTNNDENISGVVSSPYCVTVGASTSAGYSACFSNYGQRSVDVFAPGTHILSTASTDTSKTPMNKHQIPPQYLPQIQPLSDSYFYDDFEDGSNDITLQVFDNKGSAITATQSSCKGNGSATGTQLDLSAIDDGKTIMIQMTIPKDKLTTVDTTKDLYISLDCGIGNACYGDAIALAALVDGRWQYLESSYEDSQGNHGEVYTSFDDQNWNTISNQLLSPSKMMNSTDADGNLVLRMALYMSNGNNEATFRLDNVGIGKAPSSNCYETGTSMACPMVSGIAALLSGTTTDASELVARIKGGVNRSTATETGLSDLSVSGGYIDAEKAFTDPVPVVNTLAVNNQTATINGYFFGDTAGTVTVKGQAATVSSWTDNTITVTLPDGVSGTPEIKVTRADGQWGRNFLDISPTTKGYTNLTAPYFEYGTNVAGQPLHSNDGFGIAMAGAGNTILNINLILDTDDIVGEAYDTQTDTWRKVVLPQNITNSNLQLVGGKSKIYMLYNETIGESTKTMLGTYTPETDTWSTVQTEFTGTELMTIYNNQLLVFSNANTDVNILNPKTGKVTGKLTTRPDNQNMSYVYSSGNLLEIVCDKTTMSCDGQTWTVHDDTFLTDDNKVFDPKQTLQFASACTNSGLILTGPVAGLGTDTMRDTWHHDAKTGEWSADTNVLYNSTKTTHNQGTCLNGQFYVLGFTPGGDDTMIFRSTSVDYTGPTADPGEDQPTPTPTPTVQPTPTAKPNPTVSPNPSVNPSPTATPSTTTTQKTNGNLATGIQGAIAPIAGAIALIIIVACIMVAWYKRR